MYIYITKNDCSEEKVSIKIEKKTRHSESGNECFIFINDK